MPEFLTMKDLDMAMIWRFRYSKPLKNNGKALVKILQSARLDIEKERQEAMRLFNSW